MQNVFSLGLSARRREAARRYAGSCKSDPHAYNRAVAHAENGVSSFRTAKVHGKDQEVHALYDADTFPGVRNVDPRWEPLQEWQRSRKLRVTTEVPVNVYKNVCRP